MFEFSFSCFFEQFSVLSCLEGLGGSNLLTTATFVCDFTADRSNRVNAEVQHDIRIIK